MALVEGLGELQGAAGAEAEPSIGLALQAGQVVEQGRNLPGGLFDLLDGGLAAEAALHDGLGLTAVPEAFGTFVGIVRIRFEGLIKPATQIMPGPHGKIALHLKVIPGNEVLDFLLPPGKDRQRGGLDPAHRGFVESAIAGTVGGHRPR